MACFDLETVTDVMLVVMEQLLVSTLSLETTPQTLALKSLRRLEPGRGAFWSAAPLIASLPLHIRNGLLVCVWLLSFRTILWTPSLRRHGHECLVLSAPQARGPGIASTLQFVSAFSGDGQLSHVEGYNYDAMWSLLQLSSDGYTCTFLLGLYGIDTVWYSMIFTMYNMWYNSTT